MSLLKLACLSSRGGTLGVHFNKANILSLQTRKFSLKFPELTRYKTLSKVKEQIHNKTILKRNYGRWYEYSNANNKSSYSNRFNFFNNGANKIVYGIIGANVLVFFTWNYAREKLNKYHEGGLFKFMVDNFTCSVDGINSGRIWTAITSEFSHINLPHLAVNMFALYSIAPEIARFLGVKRFVNFYLLSCISASAMHYVYHKAILPKIKGVPYERIPKSVSLGSSGAVSSVVAFFSALYPNAKFLIFFVIPCPAWLTAVGFIGYDVYRSASGNKGNIDSSAHIGGAAFGLMYYWRYVRPFIRR